MSINALLKQELGHLLIDEGDSDVKIEFPFEQKIKQKKVKVKKYMDENMIPKSELLKDELLPDNYLVQSSD